MNTRRLLAHSIRHNWRTHLGVVLGSALAALVLTGALMVGDSVKATLRAQAEARVGRIGEALVCGERFVPWVAAPEKRPKVVARTFFPGPDAAGVLMLSGTAARSDGKARANKVQIVGVDDAFWKLSPSGNDPFASEERVASGRAGFQPAVPGILPGTSDVAGPPQRTTPSAIDPTPAPSANERNSTPEGPGRIPGPAGKIPALPNAPSIALNERLAAQLGVAVGDEVLIKVEKPGALSKDAPLSGGDDALVSLRMRVARVVGDAEFGRFALTSGQVPPHSAFVPLAALQEKLGVGEKVNVVLSTRAYRDNTFVRSRSYIPFFGGAIVGGTSAEQQRKMEAATHSYFDFRNGAIGPHLANFDLVARELSGGQIELRSSRIFLDSAITVAARRNEKEPHGEWWLGDTISPPPPGLDSLTYFANSLSLGDGSDAKAPATPYSFVTALDAPASGFVQAELSDDEIQITRWLADDLGAKPGDKLTMRYFVMGERRELVEKARTFTVFAPIIAMTEPRLDASWMPDFPNIPDKDSFSKWKPGFPFDSKLIRKKDEDYWRDHRGTPKAFVNLKVGQEMWGNRWGNLTSIRYPAGAKREQVERIAAFIDPAALGFRIVPLREQAFAATDAPVDFGQLFTAFSFFLIAAAAVLTGLLFTFSIEQRAAEAGLLLAVGWTRRRVKKLFLREGTLLAVIGSAVGVAVAALYTKAVLHGLGTIWRGATGGTAFIFAPSGLTVGIGLVAGVLIARLAMGLASRRIHKREAAALLSGETDEAGGGESSRARKSAGTHPEKSARALTRAAACCVAALALAAFSRGNPGMFFGAGALLLTGGLLFALAMLRRLDSGAAMDSASDLALRNTTRRRGRSLATIAVLASGVFMVVAVDSFRKDSSADATRRDSGTGGFALIGESAAPIYEDLNSAKGRAAYALDDKIMQGVRVVQMRVRDGDDASCLNLNRAVQPRIVGADFAGRAGLQPAAPGILPGASNVEKPLQSDARVLSPVEERPSTPDAPGSKPGAAGNIPALPGGDAAARFGLAWRDVLAKDATAIPGVVDSNTLQWAMQKKLGDVLEIPSERGEPLRVQFSATVSGSILQGLVLIPEKDFIEKFPNTAGTRFFLVDCPREKMDAVREHLSEQFADRGLELTPAAQRLAEFNAVENTYLSIFQVLGGLGMLLGSAGLGIVVARNVLERRREFGLLEAVGFTPRQLRALVFAEHRWLIAGALGIGAVSALVAVWPGISQKGGAFPWMNVGVLFGGMALFSALSAWAATRVALRGSQLAALRSE